MRKNVRETIVNRVISAKYFCVILDCTPDLTHQEQMSLTIRYVSDGLSGVETGIYEHFIHFIEVEGSTGLNLLDLLLQQLMDLKL